MIYLLAALLTFLLAAAYWARRWIAASGNLRRHVSYPLMALLIVTLAGLVYVETLTRTNRSADTAPVLIAVAADLSLSMGAMPDPRNGDDIGTRMDRAKKVLLSVLGRLESSGARAMISITGFTAKSETILAWDNNIAQISEVINYVLTPGLLTEPGSDLGEALDGVIPLFDNLPESYRKEDNRKFLIVVSDGEQTVEKGDVARGLKELRARGVKIVALQAGLLDTPEGIPVYDDLKRFQGFRDIAGQIYTVPDAKAMSMLVDRDGESGLYLRAEEAGAGATISDYLGIAAPGTAASSPLYLATVLTLLGLCVVILLWFT